MCNMQTAYSRKRPLGIDELDANRAKVSAHKYGFFLCKRGTARILLGEKTYSIACNHLCIYTPNTFLRILERSDDLGGILQEDGVDAYYPALSSIPVKKRLSIREHPVVVISEAEAENITLLSDILDRGLDTPPESEETGTAGRIHENYLVHLRHALCMNVCEAYFNNRPLPAMPRDREDLIFDRFLISLHTSCHRTVRYYAEEQHLSPYYFSTLIRNKSGRSALQWIAQVTMACARQYLDDPAASIKEIAERLHFPDQSTFGRYFKHHERCSPSQYRINNQINIMP